MDLSEVQTYSKGGAGRLFFRYCSTIRLEIRQPRKTSFDIASNRDEIQTGYISHVYSVANCISSVLQNTAWVRICVGVDMCLCLCTNKRVCERACVRDAKLCFQNSRL
jgi:hypothetical protein